MLGHKTSLNKFERMEIISSTFLNHNCMKLEVNYRKQMRKEQRRADLNNMLLKNNGLDFPGGAVVKNPPASAGDMGLIPGPGRSHML